jgi:hypothetical protein
MELITILNRCHRFRGFVYQQARFSVDKKSIEVAENDRARVPPHSARLPFAGARIRPTLGATF